MNQIRLISAFFIILNSMTLLSQNLQNLDTKYGIKKFKLESSYELYKNELKLSSIDDPNDKNTKYYDYIGNDFNELFGCHVKNVNLIFYKNKLYMIQVEYNLDCEKEEDLIYDKLKLLFGESNKRYSQKMGDYYVIDWAYNWSGKKTYLTFEKTSSLRDNEQKLKIWMQSTIIEKQIAEDQF